MKKVLETEKTQRNLVDYLHIPLHTQAGFSFLQVTSSMILSEFNMAPAYFGTKSRFAFLS